MASYSPLTAANVWSYCSRCGATYPLNTVAPHQCSLPPWYPTTNIMPPTTAYYSPEPKVPELFELEDISHERGDACSECAIGYPKPCMEELCEGHIHAGLDDDPITQCDYCGAAEE